MLRAAAASEGLAGDGVASGSGTGKGKGKVLDAMPSSDDSAASDDMEDQLDGAGEEEDEEDEEEEMVEEPGALSTASLVRILLDGAEDLLTLEEAYNELLIRLRLGVTHPAEVSESPSNNVDHVRIATRPIRDEAPAVVRALIRDLNRLLGKVPNTDHYVDADNSPFRGLQPLKDIHTEGHISSSPTELNKKAVKRQGYTEAEVRYRREAAGVGQAALKLLAYLLHEQALYSCFSTTDLRSLLDTAMIIPRTPRLPTPNPKRTYYASICILAQVRIPREAVEPIREKVARVVESALNETLGNMGNGGVPGGITNMSVVKKEGYHAAINLLTTYPSLFVHHYAELLPIPLKAMSSPTPSHRNKASAACAAFASAKISASTLAIDALSRYIGDESKKEAWEELQLSISRSETLVITQLKGTLKNANGQVMTTSAGDKKVEANALEQRFKDTIGTADGVQWACAAWSVVVCLLGSGYAGSGLSGTFDHIMNVSWPLLVYLAKRGTLQLTTQRSLQASNNTVRPLLARTAWLHAIRAYLLSGTITAISPSTSSNSNASVISTSYKPFQTGENLLERLTTLRLPVDLSLDMANAPGSASKALEPLTDGSKGWFWQRKEKAKKVQWMTVCGMAAAGVVYAYTGMALTHADAKEATQAGSTAAATSEADGGVVGTEEKRLRRLDQVWTEVTRPILSGLFAVKGADKLLTHGWAILLALTGPTTDSFSAEADDAQVSGWSLDRLVSSHYLEGRTFGIESEPAVAELLIELDSAGIQPADIPSCGSAWVLRNLDAVLSMFLNGLKSVQGLNDVDEVDIVKWVRLGRGQNGVVLPLVLAQVWANIVSALSPSGMIEVEQRQEAMGKVVRTMMTAFTLDPADWLPLAMINEDGTLAQDGHSTRLALLSHMLAALVKAVGQPVFLSTRITSSGGQNSAALSIVPDAAAAEMRVFGVDEKGMVPPIALVLHGLLYDPSISLPMSDKAHGAYVGLMTRIMGICVAQDVQAAVESSSEQLKEGWVIMREVCERLGGLYGSVQSLENEQQRQQGEAREAARMDVWKSIAWAVTQFDYAAAAAQAAAPVSDVQGDAATMEATGSGEGVEAVHANTADFVPTEVQVPPRPDQRVLLSLLTYPFKGDVQSFWHIHATQGELGVWRDLLQLAFRYEEGSEMGRGGLLDAWAGEVEGYLEMDARTRYVFSSYPDPASSVYTQHWLR